MTALDIKRFDTSKYRTYRVLRAPSVWSTMYRDRIRAFGNHRGVIIFPETILGLTSPIFIVRRPGIPTAGATVKSTDLGVASYLPIVKYNGEVIQDMDQLTNIEFEKTDLSKLTIASPSRDVAFHSTQFVPFRSLETAILYLEKTLRTELKRYFG